MICRICENQFLPLQSDISIMAPIVYRETTSSHTRDCAVQDGNGLEWLIQRTDAEQRKKGPNEWVEEVLNGIREAHALYSEGTEMTCCSFLAVSDQSYNCISYFFLFFRLLYFVLWKPGDLLIPSLSPAIPIITFYLQATQLSKKR